MAGLPGEWLREHGFKLVCLITRPPGQTAEAFRNWWLSSHASLVRTMPGLRHYTISVVSEPPSAPPYIDGIAELWFDDRKAMETAFVSDVGHQVASDDSQVIGERLEYRTIEYEIIVSSSSA